MPDKVVIRLINTQSLRQREAPAPKELVVYHWNRIFGALFVVLALLAGLIWGGWHILNRTDESGRNVQAPLVPAENTAGEKSVAEARQKAIPAGSERDADRPVSATPANPVIAILSPDIKRAQLTSSVVNGQAVDTLGPIIPMNDKGLVKVYLFMETSGLKGQIIYHDWSWKGKRIAHARIPIKRKDHTAASSKFIDRIMMGPWEVNIVDGNNKILAKAAFEVR